MLITRKPFFVFLHNFKTKFLCFLFDSVISHFMLLLLTLFLSLDLVMTYFLICNIKCCIWFPLTIRLDGLLFQVLVIRAWGNLISLFWINLESLKGWHIKFVITSNVFLLRGQCLYVILKTVVMKSWKSLFSVLSEWVCSKILFFSNNIKLSM